MERIFIVNFFFFVLCLYISSKNAFGVPVEHEVTLEDGTVLKVFINDPKTPPPPHFDSVKQDNKNDSSGKVEDDDNSSQNQDIIIHELKYPPPPRMESLTYGNERSKDNSSNNNDDTQDIILPEAVWAPPPVMSEKQDGNSDDGGYNNRNSSNKEEPPNVVVVKEIRPPPPRMESSRLRRNAGTGGNTEEPPNVIVVEEIRPPPPRMESRRRKRNAGTGGNTGEPPNVIVVEEIRPPPPRMESSRLKREDQPGINVNLANNMSGIAGENEGTLETHGETNRLSKDHDVNTSTINESTGSQDDLQSAANEFTTPDAENSMRAQISLNESSAVKKNDSTEMHQTYAGHTNISEGESVLERKGNGTNIRSVVGNINPDLPITDNSTNPDITKKVVNTPNADASKGLQIPNDANNAVDKPVDSAGNNSINPNIDGKDVNNDDANKGLQIPNDANNAVDKPVDSAGNNSINPDIGGKDVNNDDANKGLQIPNDVNNAVDKPVDSAGGNGINPDIGVKDVDDADASNDRQIPNDADNVVEKPDNSAGDSRINLDSADSKPSGGNKYVADTGDEDDDAFDIGDDDGDDDDNGYGINGRFNDVTGVGDFDDDKELSDQTEGQEAGNVDDDNAGGTDSGKPYSKGELLSSGRSDLQRKLVAEESQSTHFMSYFLVAVVFVACFYLVFHNRQKIKAYVLEGRSGLRGRRRKVASGEYRQLSSTEDVLPASDKKLDPKTDYAY